MKTSKRWQRSRDVYNRRMSERAPSHSQVRQQQQAKWNQHGFLPCYCCQRLGKVTYSTYVCSYKFITCTIHIAMPIKAIYSAYNKSFLSTFLTEISHKSSDLRNGNCFVSLSGCLRARFLRRQQQLPAAWKCQYAAKNKKNVASCSLLLGPDTRREYCAGQLDFQRRPIHNIQSTLYCCCCCLLAVTCFN